MRFGEEFRKMATEGVVFVVDNDRFYRVVDGKLQFYETALEIWQQEFINDTFIENLIERDDWNLAKTNPETKRPFKDKFSELREVTSLRVTKEHDDTLGFQAYPFDRQLLKLKFHFRD